MSSYNSISTEKLSRLIGTANAPILIDVRIDEDFAADPRLIPGSRRYSHLDVQDWAGRLAGQSVVVICHKGQKLSEGTAAWLRHGNISPPRFSKAVMSPGRRPSCRPFPPTRFRSGTGAAAPSGSRGSGRRSIASPAHG